VNAAQVAVGPIAHHGEGPVWDDRANCLYWVDMLAGDVLQWDGAAAPTRRHVGTIAAALRPRRGGGVVVAVERGFLLIDEGWTVQRRLPEAFSDPAIRMNDGGCDPQGRFYCGSMAYDATPNAASLYRLDPDLSTHPVLTGVTVSNGLCWDSDGATAFYVDSATQRIDAFHFSGDTGEFSERRTVVTIDPALGSPDGLTVDAEGNLWVALWDGSAVHAYSGHGELLDVVHVPTRRPSACTFGGADLTTLFITTSALGRDGIDQLAGSVFAAIPGVAGTPVLRFAG
jgi:sugar lactone lactonase YvrE